MGSAAALTSDGSDQRRVTQTAQWVLNRRPADLVMTQRGALDELPWLVASWRGVTIPG